MKLRIMALILGQSATKKFTAGARKFPPSLIHPDVNEPAGRLFRLPGARFAAELAAAALVFLVPRYLMWLEISVDNLQVFHVHLPLQCRPHLIGWGSTLSGGLAYIDLRRTWRLWSTLTWADATPFDFYDLFIA
jgi:hypothetical protein